MPPSDKRRTEKVSLAFSSLTPNFQDAFEDEGEYDKLCNALRDWDSLLANQSLNSIDSTLMDFGFPPSRAGMIALAMRKYFKERKLQSIKLPPVAGYRNPDAYYGREETLRIATDYIEGVILQTIASPSDRKVPLVGPCGVKGIGKTEFLKQVAHRCLPPISKKLNVAIEPIYVSFSGDGRNNASHFHSFQNAHAKGVVGSDNRPVLEKAFAHVLLHNCGAKVDVNDAIPLEEALEHLRDAADLRDDGRLVILVDEIGALGDETAKGIMTAVMSVVDASEGKLVVIFLHINQDVLTSGASMSGRVVNPIALPPLPLDIWKRLDLQQGGHSLEYWSEKHPGLQQLLLGLSGHPRSVFDGIPAAAAENPTLLSSPTVDDLSRARQTIIMESKLNDTTDKVVGNIVRPWLAEEPMDEQQLVCLGLLHQLPGGDIKFLFPLKVQEWAQNHAAKNALAFHIHKMFARDGSIGSFTENDMAWVLSHYEAAKLIAIGEGKRFSLGWYYRCAGCINSELSSTLVRCKIPIHDRHSFHMYTVPSFGSSESLGSVFRYLQRGYIAVSENPAELGVAYLVPFFTVEGVDEKMLVACVKCKFVEKSTSWVQEIDEKMDQAIKHFKSHESAKDADFFPVVFTTADEKAMGNASPAGAYFAEHEVFRFTSLLGMLRLHLTKLGKVTKNSILIL